MIEIFNQYINKKKSLKSVLLKLEEEEDFKSLFTFMPEYSLVLNKQNSFKLLDIKLVFLVFFLCFLSKN
jgi:hypothetical protein